MSASRDAVADVVWLPFATGLMPFPDVALFVGARMPTDFALQARLRGTRLHAVQPFKPAHDALQSAGVAVSADDQVLPSAPTVLLLPPRSREQSRAWMARALSACEAGGVVVACVANDAGAKSAESDLKQLAGIDGVLSKHHCRVFWARKRAERIDNALLQTWSALDAPRRIAATGAVSRPGVFAWDRVDVASALLARHLPAHLRGHIADLGAGWGYLTRELLARNPGITAVDLYEADVRALACAEATFADAPVPASLHFHWHDVTHGLPQQYDAIVMNPPFHALDATPRPALGQRFVQVAADALKPGGQLWLVANRQLPYETALAHAFPEVQVLAQENGFKVVHARKAPR